MRMNERPEETDKSGKNSEGERKIGKQEGKNRSHQKRERYHFQISHLYASNSKLNPILERNILYDYIFKIFILLQASHFNIRHVSPSSRKLVLF